MTNPFLAEYDRIMADYEALSYTPSETTSRIMGLLDECDSESREILRSRLPDWMRDQIQRVLTEFDETAEPFALRPADPVKQHQMLTALKRWWFRLAT
jgi:hypothetical protein